MCIAYIAQILADFLFHAVAHILGLLDALKQFLEFLVIGSGVEVLNHVQHMLHLLAEYYNLLLGLEYRYFRGLHDTAANELQTELVLIIGLAGFDYVADQFLQLGNETYQQRCVYYVECGVECSQGKG